MGDKDHREIVTRRSSFRQSLAESSLQSSFLDALEQKRKQLDESIHKYIAAKEREYKQFEKDIKQQHKLAQSNGDPIGISKRRISSESTQQSGDSPTAPGCQRSAVGVLLATSSRREADTSAVEADENATSSRLGKAGLTDGRASIGHDREFTGFFTPPYLSALEDQHFRTLDRISSTPPLVEAASNKSAQIRPETLDRANSDTAVQAKPKRPAHLQLVQRTSSSGSSADSRLVSAMKSPSEVARPKRKRVSLAVGDAIVAPSDTVPLAQSNNHTPSHSRTRSPAAEKERASGSLQSAMTLAESTPSRTSIASSADQLMPSGGLSDGIKAIRERQGMVATSAALPAEASTAQPPGDDLGDLSWHLEESDDAEMGGGQAEEDRELDELSGDEITGRVGDAGSLPRLKPLPRDTDDGELTRSPNAADSATDSAVQLVFRPGPTMASGQPNSPGFRRPSVGADPVFSGSKYESTKFAAVEIGIYGSSYTPPGNKATFAGGSLGESYMAKHAEEMMKLRAARQEGQVKP